VVVMTIVIEKGRAEVLTLYPPRQFLARPSAADIRVGTPAVAMPDAGNETSITANIDATNTTVAAAVTRGADTLTLTSASDVTVGRRFLVTSLGRHQQVRVRAKDGTTVYLFEPLRDDVATAATFVGLAVTHTLTTAQTALVGLGEIVYRLTLLGTVRRLDEKLRIEDRLFALTLTEDDLVSSMPEVRRLREAADLTLDSVIRTAWEDYVRVELGARKIIADRIMTPSALEPAIKEACVLVLMRGASRPSEDIKDQEQRLYQKINRLFDGKDLWYAEPATVGSSSTNEFGYQNTAWLTR
jgi:hypothetical protein